MEILVKAIQAAAAILEKGASVARSFVTKNTPESALLAALGVAFATWQNGDKTAAAVIAAGALITFIAAESSKDAASIARGTPAP